MSDMNSNKRAAVAFLEMIVLGSIDEAFDSYIDMQGTHHNVFIRAGMEALRKEMKDAGKKFPNMKFDLQHVLAEGDIVAVHSHLTLSDKMDFTAVHVLRFEGGKIVEFWDIAGDLPAEIPNTDGAF